MNLLAAWDVASLSMTAILLAKITLILAAAWTVHCFLQRGNPRWRILLWRFSALGLAGVAVLSLKTPLIKLPLLPASPAKAVAQSALPTSIASKRSSQSQHTQRQQNQFPPTRTEHAQEDSLTPSNRPSAKIAPAETVEVVPEPTPRAANGDEPMASFQAQRRSSRPAWSSSFWVFLIWGIGVLLGMFQMLVGIVTLSRICRS